MSWVSLALTLLKIVSTIMTWARERELIDKGYDQAVADAAAEIMKKTAAGKAMLEKVNAMSDSEVDDALRNLEPR